MCWNWQVSIGTFIIVSLVCYHLIQRSLPEDRAMAFFIFSYGIMQLFETMMWIGQDKKYQAYNKIGTFLASLLLFAHPLLLLLGVQSEPNMIGKDIFNYNLNLAVAIIGLVTGFWISYDHLVKKKRSFLSYPHVKTGHLVWDIPSYYIESLFSMLYIFYLYFSKPMMGFSILYYLGPLLYLVYNNWSEEKANKVAGKYKRKIISGSYWCWHVATFSFIIYYFNSYLKTGSI